MDATTLFEKLARAVWQLLGESRRNHVLLGEDAVTSILLNLLTVEASTIFCEDSRLAEAKRGCDFELWIGTEATGWLRYAVQAKKLTLSTGKYAGLAHRVGGRPQIDILEEYSRANRAEPIYCFYNHSAEAHGWTCRLPRETQQLGCSVAPATLVRKALATRGARSYKWIHGQPDTVPWRCLTYCSAPLAGTAACETQCWVRRPDKMHSRLPQALEFSRRGGQQRDVARVTLGDLFGDARLFAQTTPLRPVRLAVVDLTTAQEIAPSRAVEDSWADVTSLLSPLLYSPRVDAAEAANLLSPLKTHWQMPDEVFAIYVESCMKSGHILRESDFIKILTDDIDMSDHARVKAIILYLLSNIGR